MYYFEIPQQVTNENAFTLVYYLAQQKTVIPRIWNTLPVIDLNDHPTNIKSKLSEYLWKHFLSNFDPGITCSFSLSCPCFNCAKVPKQPNFDNL